MDADEVEITIRLKRSSVALLERGIDVGRHWVEPNGDGTYSLCATKRTAEIDDEGLRHLVDNWDANHGQNKGSDDA